MSKQQHYLKNENANDFQINLTKKIRSITPNEIHNLVCWNTSINWI